MKTPDPFLDPRSTPERLYDYRLRRDILAAIKENLPHFEGILLDVGCGQMPYRALLRNSPSRVEKYIGLDVAGGIHGQADVTFDGREIPFPDTSVNTVIATEVLEHCEEPAALLREIFRVLVPRGLFFFTVPCFWPLHEVPHDYYRYTPFSLRHLLAHAGFDDNLDSRSCGIGRQSCSNARSLVEVSRDASLEAPAAVAALSAIGCIAQSH